MFMFVGGKHINDSLVRWLGLQNVHKTMWKRNSRPTRRMTANGLKLTCIILTPHCVFQILTPQQSIVSLLRCSCLVKMLAFFVQNLIYFFSGTTGLNTFNV